MAVATLILHTPQGDTAFSVETGALLADALLTHGHSTDRPCDVFSRLEFPTSDFFPGSTGGAGACGANPKNC